MTPADYALRPKTSAPHAAGTAVSVAGCRAREQMLVEVAGQQTKEMQPRVLAFPNAVAAVGVRHHIKRLVVLDQLVDEGFATLVVTVVVARAVNEQQVASELMGERDG